MNITDHLPLPIQTLTLNTPQVLIYAPFVRGADKNSSLKAINDTLLHQVQILIRKQNFYQHPEQTEVWGYYEVKTNERKVLSLILSNYAYTQKAAHGMTYMKGLTFDVESGKDYALKDLFKPGSPYVQTLSKIIKEQIKKRGILLLDDFTEIKPDQDFYIADKCLVIFFQLYEITAYVFGFPMFPISVYELENIIDENGPLGKMLPSE